MGALPQGGSTSTRAGSRQIGCWTIEDCDDNYAACTVDSAFTDLPEGLLLQLLRARGGLGNVKNFRHVALPEELDMAPHAKPSVAGAAALAAAGGALCNRLVAVVVHTGASMSSGHYFKFAYLRALPAPAVQRQRRQQHQQQRWQMRH